MYSESLNESAAADAFLDQLFSDRDVKNVLLVVPPDSPSDLFRIETARRGRYANYPPYGLGVIATHLRDHGLNVQLLNLNQEVLAAARNSDSDFDFDQIWQSKLAHVIGKFKPDMVGMTCMFTQHHDSFKNVGTWIKENFQLPIAIGGVHVSNDSDRVLDDIPAIDIAFLREADAAIRNFIDVVNRVQPISELRQVVLNIPGGRTSGVRASAPDKDQIEVVPAYDLMDVSDLSRSGSVGIFYSLLEPQTRIATLISNRGCRAQCTFCSVRTFNGKGVRHRGTKEVIDEWELLEKEYGIGHISWLDDDLLKDERRAVEMFEEKIRRGLKSTWDATNGVLASSLTQEVTHAMAASGCIGLAIGVESGNREILKNIRKPGTPETFLRAAEVVRQFEEIFSTVLLMVGFPGETYGQIKETMDLALEMNLDWHRVSPLHPLPNTPIYDEMEAAGSLPMEEGRISRRWVGGPFGKQMDIEQGIYATETDFSRILSKFDSSQVPDRETMSSIYTMMQYTLNFKRAADEIRPAKQRQLLKFVRNICDLVSMDNAFALYFSGVLEGRVEGAVRQETLGRLANRLETSVYWRDIFEYYDINLENLTADRVSSSEMPLAVS